MQLQARDRDIYSYCRLMHIYNIISEPNRNKAFYILNIPSTINFYKCRREICATELIHNINSWLRRKSKYLMMISGFHFAFRSFIETATGGCQNRTNVMNQSFANFA